MRLSVRSGLATAAVLAAVLLAAGAVRQALDQPRPAPAAQTTAAATPPAAPAAPPAPAADTAPAEVAPPGVEVVPETETAPPATAEVKQSFGRAAGLHRTKDPLRLASSAALAIDQNTGRVLVQKNEDAVLPIASLTKLMTAIIVAESRIPLDDEITITQEDVDNERHSRSRLRVGTTLSRAEALHLALMSSENRAAHALGRTFPGGLDQFVNAMNNRARQLGMKSTTFVDPTGLSNRNQSTARDLATLAMAAAKHERLREYSTTERRQVELGGRTLLYNNSNRLVKSPEWDIRLQKTGYIVEAGQCVAMNTRIAGHNVVMVLLDAGDKRSRSADAERIKRWVSAQTSPGDATLALAKDKPKS
jgi:serine-type D-Ala-D-Ala endopeptidase (penicillin-binding protein 7)